MRSLRSRLGLAVAASLGLLALVAALSLTYQRWQEADLALTDDVSLASFQLSEAASLEHPDITIAGSSDVFAVLFGESAEVLAVSGDVNSELEELLVDEIWTFTNVEDTAVSIDFDDEDGEWFSSGVRCTDSAVCDTAIVGARRASFAEFWTSNLLWLVVPVLLAIGLGWFATRWLVGRSLRPVESMRRELDMITESDLDRRVPVPESNDEIQRLGTSMNQTIGRLGTALTANQRFVADAAHELRSPITGVRAALELVASREHPTTTNHAADGDPMSNQPRGLINESVDELDRASRLIDDLLVLAKRQGGPIARTDVDVDDLARSAINMIEARHPALTIERKIEPVRVSADPDALNRIVTNLLENAARYGNGRVVLSLSPAPGDSSTVRLQVDDDGPGIPPEQRDLIFERFARLDDSRSRATGGSGLGLAIVRELTEAHQGTITVETSELGGARFVVLVPSA